MPEVMLIAHDAIGGAYTEAVTRAKALRAEGVLSAESLSRDDPLRPYKIVNGALVVPITGVLLRSFDITLEGVFTGYDYIVGVLRRAAEDVAVERVALFFDTPGGEVQGVMEAAAAIRSVGKPVTAYVRNALSAGYWLAAQAEWIDAEPTAQVGSIGVIVTHVSVEEALRNSGVEVTLIYAGEHKADFSPFKKLSESARAEIEGNVRLWYSRFASAVAAGREISLDGVIATQARIYEASEALKIGLVDSVLPGAAHVSIGESVAREEEGMPMAKKTENGAVGSAVEPEVVQEIDVSVIEAEARSAERQRIKGILSAEEAEGRSALAMKLAFDTEMGVEQAREILAAAPKEAAAVEAQIVADAPSPKLTAFEQAMAAGAVQVGAAADVDVEEDVPLHEKIKADYLKMVGQ